MDQFIQQNEIRSDQTRMNGIGLTSRSDVRLPPPTDAPLDFLLSQLNPLAVTL